MQNRTNSSLTLSWTAPVGPDHPSYTYWVSWVMEGTMVINTQDTRVSNTSDTRITLEQLEAGSLYTFTVQAERNGVSSDNRTLTEATDQTQAGSRQTQYCGDGGGRGLGRLW